MNIFLMVTYVLSAVAGSTLIKYGSGSIKLNTLFIVPVVDMRITIITFIGVVAYGISFLAYVILLTKFDLSYISPLLIAFVYLLLMVTAFLIFKETFTLAKTIGCMLILCGIILVISRN